MAEYMGITTALTAISIVLLCMLLWIYIRNYSRIKSGFTVGLMLFAALFLLQNLISLYFFLTMMPYYAAEVEMHVFILTLLQTAAFSVMLWNAWK